MICSKCNTKGIYNVVLNKEFYYCRNCKDEIQETSSISYSEKKDTSFSFKVGDLIGFTIDDARRNVKRGNQGLIANMKYDRDGETIYEVEYFTFDPFSVERAMFYRHEIELLFNF